MRGAVAPGDDLLSIEMGARGVRPADVPAAREAQRSGAVASASVSAVF